MVDEERVTWVRLFGIPCHVWNDEFFRFMALTFGAHIRADNVTESQAKLDVAHFLICTKCYLLINEVLSVNIEGLVVKMKVVEDTQGPLRVYSVNNKETYSLSESLDEEGEIFGEGVGCLKKGCWRRKCYQRRRWEKERTWELRRKRVLTILS